MTPTIDLKNSKIYIGKGLLSNVGAHIHAEYPMAKVLVITDSTVNALYSDTLETELISHGIAYDFLVLPDGEKTKDLKNIGTICEMAAEMNLNRGDVILALGGGVIGDLAGFAAAVYLRGIRFVAVPTTLLSQVDSSVGGKTGVNLPQGKNLVGCFYKANSVLIDTDTLTTLSDREFACGMAEVIKYGCIWDEELFSKLEGLNSREKVMGEIEAIVTTCCEIKAKVVREDEFDKGLRMILNFGHTIGHAIENTQGYGELTHGEAVAIGMSKMTKNTEAMGLTKIGASARTDALIEKHGLPTEMADYDKKRIFEAAMKDKKNIGKKLNIIALKKIGEVEIVPIDPERLVDYL
ncbi:MAG: 3-dehydroquinate synthase [Eubacteriales bacterium]